MILDLLFSAIRWLFDTLMGAFDALLPSPPGWLIEGLMLVGDVWDYLHQLDNWIPVNLALGAAALVLGCYLVSMMIGLIRVVASYVTFGGGAT